MSYNYRHVLRTTIAVSVFLTCVVLWVAHRTGGELKCQDFELKSVTSVIDGKQRQLVPVKNSVEMDRITGLLCHAKFDPVVFFATYKIAASYKDSPVTVMVSGEHFMLNGVTYKSSENLADLLAKNF